MHGTLNVKFKYNTYMYAYQNLPCLSKLSSLRMQTNAKNLFTSLRYNMVPLFNFITLELCESNAAASVSSRKLKI
jgi:hypothetical protein